MMQEQKKDTYTIERKIPASKHLLKEAQIYGLQYLPYIDQAVTHYHAVEVCKKKLLEAGFLELHEN